jgi:ribosome maturation factor RimP
MDLYESIRLVVEGEGLKLYDIATLNENQTNIFRIYVTSKDGVTLDQCAKISNLVSPLLDVNEPMSGKYTLEVSSPGIERKLKTLDHFKASIGENVKIKEYSTQTLKGLLLDVQDDGTITIEDEDNDKQTINFDDILSSATYFQWKK